MKLASFFLIIPINFKTGVSTPLCSTLLQPSVPSCEEEDYIERIDHMQMHRLACSRLERKNYARQSDCSVVAKPTTDSAALCGRREVSSMRLSDRRC